MFSRCVAAVLLLLTSSFVLADDPKPEPKITPGQPIVPPKMRRIWGELVKLDLEKRTGVFRNQSNDELMEFTVMPYAELLHHAASGDLQDFIVGERAIFRLHEDEQGNWPYLTYIQDGMNFFNNHHEWYWIDAIDKSQGVFTCHQANDDQSFVREKEVLVNFDKDSKFYRQGAEIGVDEVKVGDRMQVKTHGVGRGIKQIIWLAFLDTPSLQKFQAEQKQVHAQRLQQEGLPGYLDALTSGEAQVSLFRETSEFAKQLKPGMAAQLAIAGSNRQAQGKPIATTVNAVKQQGVITKVTLTISQPLPGKPGDVIRLWSTPASK